MMKWARHHHAPYYLGAVSFIESSFFPLPPDVMLAPMCLGNPKKAWYYAALTVIASVLGALLGYLIGMFFFEWASPFLVKLGYWPAYEHVQHWFAVWGGWVMFVAAFSPIPFKLFTIAGGAMHMPLSLFLIGSIVGRSLRFFLVAGLMRWGGSNMDLWLKRYIDRIGWSVVVFLVFGYGVYQLIICLN